MMYEYNDRDLLAMEMQLLDEIEKEKKFTFKKFIKLLELQAIMGR